MTLDEVVAFMRSRYGPKWMKRFAADSEYDYTAIWRMANGLTPVTRRMKLEIELLKTNQQKLG